MEMAVGPPPVAMSMDVALARSCECQIDCAGQRDRQDGGHNRREVHAPSLPRLGAVSSRMSLAQGLPARPVWSRGGGPSRTHNSAAGDYPYVPMVRGGAVVDVGRVGGTDVVVAGAVVVVAGAVVVTGRAVVVVTGATVVPGGRVGPGPALVVAVTAGGGRTVAAVPGGAPTGTVSTVVVVGASVLLVTLGMVVEVVVGRAKVVVVVDARVATCLGLPSEPVATSKSSPTMAIEAIA